MIYCSGGIYKMKIKIIGILICTLLITNLSAVLGTSEEKENTIEKTDSFVFENTLNQEDVKYIILDTDMERGTPRGTVAGTYDNLAPNPSFEEGDTMPTGWTYLSDPNFPDVVYSWDSTVAHSGLKSIGLSNIFVIYVDFAWHTTDLIPVDLTQNVYEFSVWYKFNKIPTKDYWAWQGFGMYDKDQQLLFQWYFRKNPTTEWTLGRLLTSFSSMSPYLADTKYVELSFGKWERDRSIEVRYDDVFFGIGGANSPPDKPNIPSGSTEGKIGVNYNFSTSTTDPDGDQVRYNFSWGDGTYSGWIGSYLSGEVISASHNWSEKGQYQIKVKARDYWGGESDWSDPLPIKMPYSYDKPIPRFLELLFQRFSNAKFVYGPELEIGIFGASIVGLRRVGFVIHNGGDQSASDVQWVFTIKSIGNGEIDYSYSDTRATLRRNSAIQFATNEVNGFGLVTLSLSVSSPNAGDKILSAKGFQIGPYTISRPWILAWDYS